jgi:hypothetical protein
VNACPQEHAYGFSFVSTRACSQKLDTVNTSSVMRAIRTCAQVASEVFSPMKDTTAFRTRVCFRRHCGSEASQVTSW